MSASKIGRTIKESCEGDKVSKRSIVGTMPKLSLR